MSMDVATGCGVAELVAPRMARVHIGCDRVRAKTARAVVVSCPDCRTAGGVVETLVRQAFGFLHDQLFDDPRLGGGVLGLADFATPEHSVSLRSHIDLLANLHSTPEVILTSHGGCGWCRLHGKVFSCRKAERQFHIEQGIIVARKVRSEMPHRTVHYAYLELDDVSGDATLEPISID